MGDIVRYDQLYPGMAVELPGVEDRSFLRALRDAGRRFCDRTEIWAWTLDPIDLVEEQLDYTLAHEWQAVIKRVLEVRINSEAGVTAGTKGNAQDESLYEFTPPSTLTLDDSLEPGADLTDGLEADVVLVPNLRCDEIPEYIIERWGEAIMAGAIAELKRQPNRGWTDPDGAGYFQTQWNRGLNAALREGAVGYRVGKGLEA
jgi:hypothetical protein